MKKIFAWVLVMAICGVVNAEVLKRAEVTAVVNDVSISDSNAAAVRPAKIKDVVTGKTAVNTGSKSRAELLFDDKTLARLGANTVFTFEEGTRNMDLKQGNMLLQVPKGAGGATIRTAAVTAAITGTTVMISHQPGQAAKVIVLEGTLRLFIKGQMGESILIKPGQMIFMDPKSTKLPEPVDVNLKTLVGTSGLVQGVGSDSGGGTGGTGSNLNMDIIGNQVNQQQQLINSGTLGDTNLLVLGEGGDVTVGNDELMAAIEQAVEASTDETKYKHPVLITDSTLATIDANTTIQTDPTISRNGVTDSTSGGYYDLSADNPESPSQFIGFTARSFDDSSGFNSVSQIDSRDYAGFKFGNDVAINGQPTINTGGSPAGLALIAATDTSGTGHSITSNANLNLPVDLALITEDGNITLNASTFTMNGHELFAYARGAGRTLTDSAVINAGGGDVNFSAEQDVLSYANISGASRFEAKAGRNFRQNAGTNLQAQDIQIHAGLMGSGLADIGTIDTSSVDWMYIDAPTVNFLSTSACNFPDGTSANVYAGTGGISTAGTLMGLNYVYSGGSIVAAGDFGAGIIEVDGGLASNISASGKIVSPYVSCTGTSVNVQGLQVREFYGDSTATTLTIGSGGIQSRRTIAAAANDPTMDYFIRAKSVSVTSGGSISGFSGAAIGAGTSGESLEIDVTDPISLSNLSSAASISFSGTSGNASGGNFTLSSDGQITADRNVDVGTTGNGAGGMIYFKSAASSGTGISVSNSTQLLALVQSTSSSGGMIHLEANNGADIVLSGGASSGCELNASNYGKLSEILLDTLKSGGGGGNISLSGATYPVQMLADTIRIRSGNNMTLANATLTATDLIKLFAANLITFQTAASTLTAPNIYIAAPMVDISVVPTTSGNVFIYRDSGTGNIPGATVKAYNDSTKPTF